MATKAQHRNEYKVLPIFMRELREEAGLTQREIGELLGKPQSWVHNNEVATRRVDWLELIQWAEACGVNPKTAFNRLLKKIGK